MRRLALALIICASSTASAGSFRGGAMSWQAHDLVAPRTVELVITTVWDEPAAGTRVSVDFGDGSSVEDAVSQLVFAGTTTSLHQAYTVRRATLSHTYAGEGPYTASISGCCRHPTANVPSLTAPFRLETVVDTRSLSFGSPMLLSVDAQISVVTGASVVSFLSKTWWDGRVLRAQPVSLASLALPTATSTLEIEANGLVLLQVGATDLSVGNEYTIDARVDDFGGVASTIELVAESVPLPQHLPACWDVDVGLQPGMTVEAHQVTTWATSRALVTASSATFTATSDTEGTVVWTPTLADAGSYDLGCMLVADSSTSACCPVALRVPLSQQLCEMLPVECASNEACIDTSTGFRCVGSDPTPPGSMTPGSFPIDCQVVGNQMCCNTENSPSDIRCGPIGQGDDMAHGGGCNAGGAAGLSGLLLALLALPRASRRRTAR